MDLVSSTRYLEVLLKTLNEDLIPDLKSAATRKSATAMRDAMLELLRRETVTPQILQLANARGVGIVQDVASFLAREGSKNCSEYAVAMTRMHAVDSNTGDYQSLQKAFNTITGVLNDGARYICALRGQYEVDGQPAANSPVSRIGELLRRITEWECEYYSKQAAAAPPQEASAESAAMLFGKKALETFIRDSHVEWKAACVDEFSPLSGGLSKQTFLAKISAAPGLPEECVVRKGEFDPILRVDAFVLPTEFELVRAIHGAGYPVAKPLLVCADRRYTDGPYFLMEKMHGEMPGDFFRATIEITGDLLRHIAQLLAKLHSIPLEVLADYINAHEAGAVLHETVHTFYHRKLTYWKAYIASIDLLPSPAITFALDWLFANLPRNDSRPVVVHGDFNIHNTLVMNQRVTAILDWETAGFGAPEQDLAYIKPHIERIGNWSEFVSHYLAAGGRRFDERTFNYYLTFALFRLLVGTNRGVYKFAEGQSKDIRSTEVDLAYWPEFIANLLVQTASK